MLLTIIIPSRNAGHRLDRTLKSICDQTVTIKYEIIIVDNDSTDNTSDVIKNYVDLPVLFIREPDHGMYDALAKGLLKARGLYHTYINCGDLYEPCFFDTVCYYSKTSSLWLIGYPSALDNDWRMTHVRQHPVPTSRLIRYSYFNGFFQHYIQQESVFWHSSLTSKINLNRLRQFKLAGDAFIWKTFAGISSPTQVPYVFASYTHHQNALSSNRSFYLDEFYSIYPRYHIAHVVFFLLLGGRLLCKIAKAVELLILSLFK